MNDIQLSKSLNDLKDTFDGLIDKAVTPLREDAEKNQKALDSLLVKGKEAHIPRGGGSFGDVFANELQTQFKYKANEFAEFAHNKDAKIAFSLKSVGTMTLGNLTGDGQGTYNPRQGIAPGQKINFRDLIPTAQSPTGIYITYRETGTEGSIGDQVEGAVKPQIDYDFTEIKNVSGYVAGWARFSKQMMFQLPFLQNTLTRMLLRDFYKRENRKFYDYVAANATGFTTTNETDDAKALIDILMGRADRDFTNSYVLVNHKQVGRLLKLLYENGMYLGSGSVVGTAQGQVIIAGAPLIGVSWATSDKVMVIDADFIERVETDSLKVEFSYEDSDNFQRNLVTARVECFEDLNLLRTDAHSYSDFDNS